ncbi:hypothetical protein OO184_23930 [Photorhabdus sp. APURE]|nr:hypothetical protein [Photorhabdus aballayi]MCW7550893.1 hypothetical protein [Photorhabdus aballayi]
MTITEKTNIQEITAVYLLNRLQLDESAMSMYERLGKECDSRQV